MRGEQVGQAEARCGGGQGRLPVRFQAQVARRVGAEQSDQDLRHDPAADRAQAVAAAAVLGLFEDVEPERGAVRPA